MENFEEIVQASMDGERPDMSEVDAVEFLRFACEVAHTHLFLDESKDESDGTGKKRHSRAFVCEALVLAMKNSQQ